MRKWKQSIAVLTALACLLAALPVFAQPQQARTIEPSYLAEAGGILDGLGIMNASDIEARAGEYVNRNEFAHIIASLGRLATNEQPSFADVPEDEWAAGAIAAVVRDGYMQDVGSNKFAPYIPVTYEEAMRAFIKLLGYDVMYPYQSFAVICNQLKLTRSYPAGQKLTRGDVVEMAYTALDTPMMTMVSVGDSVQYDTSEYNTLAVRVHELTRGTGVVSATYDTALAGESNIASKENLKIGNAVYKCADAAPSEYLGYNVVYYYDEDGNIRAIAKSKNTVLVLDAAAGITYDGTEYQYDVDGRRKTARVPQNAYVLYNGKAMGQFDADKMVPQSGQVELIANGGDGTYNVVKITDYRYTVVAGVSAADSLIMDKNGTNKLDFKETDKPVDVTIVDTKGNPVAIEDIKEWNIIASAVAEDSRSKLIYAIVSQESTSGILEEIGDKSVIINGLEYDLVEGLQTELLSLGNEYTFYLDHTGQIAAFETLNLNAEKIGFLIDVKLKNVVDSYVDVKLATSAGKVEYLQTSANLRVDGQKLDASEAEALLKSCIADSQEVILYSLDKNGAIHSIKTAQVNSLEQPISAKNRLLKYFGDGNTELTYRLESHTFNGKVTVGGSTVVFKVPKKGQEGDALDSDYTAEGIDRLYDKNDYVVDAYSITGNFVVADILVCRQDIKRTLITTDRGLCLVKKITSVLDEEGKTVQKVYLLENGTERYVNVTEPEYLSGIAVGDTIRYQVNAREEMTGPPIVVYSVRDRQYLLPNPSPADGTDTRNNLINSNLRISYGSVYDFKSNTVALVRTDEDIGAVMTPEMYNLLENHAILSGSIVTNIYVYDDTMPEGYKVRMGTVGDIVPRVVDDQYYTKMIVRMREGTARDIVIYKFAQ